jgi:hypothetical protein
MCSVASRCAPFYPTKTCATQPWTRPRGCLGAVGTIILYIIGLVALPLFLAGVLLDYT